jgi:hypothetical protein
MADAGRFMTKWLMSRRGGSEGESGEGAGVDSVVVGVGASEAEATSPRASRFLRFRSLFESGGT